MAWHTLADITIAATNTAQALSATDIVCNYFQINGITVASSVRVGDSNVGAARGAPILASGAQFSPPLANTNAYNLKYVYVSGTVNDVVSVLYNTA